jgi:hypothetical protein
MRFVVLGTPAIGAKHFFPSSAPALKAGAVDLVIQRAEESEMAFFGRREFADYLPAESSLLISSIAHAKIRHCCTGDPPLGAGWRRRAIDRQAQLAVCATNDCDWRFDLSAVSSAHS